MQSSVLVLVCNVFGGSKSPIKTKFRTKSEKLILNNTENKFWKQMSKTNQTKLSEEKKCETNSEEYLTN